MCSVPSDIPLDCNRWGRLSMVVVIRAEMQMCCGFRRWIGWSKSGAYAGLRDNLIGRTNHCLAVRSFIDPQSHLLLGISIRFGCYNPVSHGIVRLAEDTLFTHSNYTPFASHRVVPVTTEQSTESEDETPELEWFGSPGRIVILRWLGLNRFFPPGATRHQDILRGCVAVSWTHLSW